MLKYTIQGPFKMVVDGQVFLVDGKISVEQNDVPRPIDETAGAKYTLRYKKLNGDINTYNISEIVSMDAKLLKAIVNKKGYRSFRNDHVISLEPVV